MTAITSPGSGSASLGNINYKTQSTDNTAAGALLGGLLGLALQSKKNNDAKKVAPPPDNKPISVPDANAGAGGRPSGSESSASGTSYVSPYNNPWTGQTPGGIGTYIGGGGTGTAGSIKYPAGTTQDTINADMGMTNGLPNAIIAGVNPSTGEVIAQLNYNIPGSNLISSPTDTIGSTGVAGITDTAIPPTGQTPGTYFQDNLGNIYDGDGNLYAVNSQGAYYVKMGDNEWMNVDTGDTWSNSDVFGNTGGGYDESYITDTLPEDNSYLDYINSQDSNYEEPFIYEDSFNYGGSNYDDYNYFGDYDYGDYGYEGGDYLYAKNGGLATPLFAKGGKVRHFEDGGSTGILNTIENLLSNYGVTGAIGGGILGSLLSGSGGSNNLISQGVDMSTVGRIAPRTTTFGMGPANVVTNYGAVNPAPYAPIGNILGSPTPNYSQFTQTNTGYAAPNMPTTPTTPTSGGGLGTITYTGGNTGGTGTGGTGTGGTETGGGDTTSGGLPKIPNANDYKKINDIISKGYKDAKDYQKAQAEISKILNKIGGISTYTPPTGAPSADIINAFLASQYTAPLAGQNKTFFTYGTPVNVADNLPPITGGLKDGGQPELGYGVPEVQGRSDYRHGAPVMGPGDGQSDDIPAMLADGEYVIDSEIVSALGNGSNKAGAQALDKMRHAIRKHKRSGPLSSIPPKAKSPLEYVKMGAKMKGSK